MDITLSMKTFLYSHISECGGGVYEGAKVGELFTDKQTDRTIYFFPKN